MSETYNPLRQSAQADKFQVFEQWLRDNGAQFPLLELRQYDASADRACETEVDDDGDSDVDGEGANEEKKESSPSPPLPPGDDGSSEMRSVHATAAIPPQTTVVSIPKRCLITVEMGQATPIGRKILSSSLELDAPKHIFLMIYLLWDRKVRGPSSFFHPYYAILPTSLRNMPVFWTDDELRLLRGSHLLHQIRDRIDAIDDDYRAICALCPEFPAVASREEFRWARMIVCSRNFGLLVDGRRTSALVPHADMLNHRRPRETKWTFDDETQCFTITTLREMEAGEQVYDSYGQKCNHRFLLNYGFAVEDNREVDGFCPNEVPLELGLDLCWGLDEDDEEAEGEEKDEGRMGAKVSANAGKAKERAKKGWNSPEERECWEKKLAFWTRGESAAQYGDSSGNIGGDVGLSSSFQALAAAVAGTTGRGGGMSASIAGAISAMNDASSSSLNDCDMTSVATSGAGMAPSNATAAGHARNGGAATNISNNSNYHQNTNHPHHNNLHQNHANTPPPTRPAICPVKRIRVCVSNNENTRILFSMLRVLACTSSELDQIAWGTRLRNPNSNPAASSSPFYGSAATSTAHRLLGLAPPHSSPPSSALRTCRDVRHPLSLSNERRAMRLLLRITTRALAAYPTTLARDVADLKDLRAYPRYSNRRHAKVQVKGEKEVLHHFALWARTAMHVMDIIGHELERERREVMLRFSEAGILCGGGSGGGGGGGGKESVVAAASAGAAARSDDDNDTRELGYDYVIQAMEDDDDCHTTILRYCSDVLGAVRRDELNRIATDAAIRSKIGGNWTRTS